MFVRKKAHCVRCAGVLILRPQDGKLVVECRLCGHLEPAKPEASGHPLLLIQERGSSLAQVPAKPVLA